MATRPKMSWEKSSSALVDLFAELVPTDPGVERKQMFGWPCCFVNDNLFAGLHKEYALFRLSEKDQALFLRLDGAAEFEPMPGRKMKGYVTLAGALTRDRKQLTEWLRRALQYARRLPAKKK